MVADAALAGIPRSSVRVRITWAAVAVVGLALLLGAIALVASLYAVLTREVRITATVRAAEVARVVQSGGQAAVGDDVTFQVLDAGGEVLAASPNAAGRPPLIRLAPGESRVIGVPFDDGRFLAVATTAGTGRTVVLGQSLDPVDEPTRTLVTLLAIGLPALLLVVAATAWRLVGRALAPVDAIRIRVDAISAIALDRRVPEPSTRDEIGRLAATMNRMLDRLEQAQLRERRFVADASHELRSPIAAIPLWPGMRWQYRSATKDGVEVVSITERAQVPAGSYHGMVMTKETTPLEPGVLERKYYARGIGMVLTVDVSAGTRDELIAR